MDLLPDIAPVILVLVGFAAAVVNGALGHGFSSLTVPVAMLFYTSTTISPALVPLEIAINGYLLLITWRTVPTVWRRILPMLVGLAPGIVFGSWLLLRVDATQLKLGVFAVLLPLILVQAAGVRRPIPAERAVGALFGTSVGTLYSVTTISGPPLALLFNNQGLVKLEFRAALALIRTAESALTGLVYTGFGLYSRDSLRLLLMLMPAATIGIPLGTVMVRRLDAAKFRRICMSFDVWIVAFGLARTLGQLELTSFASAYAIMAAAVVLDVYLLARFFGAERARVRRPAMATIDRGPLAVTADRLSVSAANLEARSQGGAS